MSEAKKGNMFIIAEMVLWSLFPIVSILGFKGLDIIISFFWVNLFATLFFLILMMAKGRWAELKNKMVWLYTLATVVFICIIFYGAYFYALGSTLPANASIVALFEVVPTYIFFQIIKKESFMPKHLVGIVLGAIGALIVLLPKAGGVHTGDWIILCATFFPPIGNYYQQKARKLASTETILFLRHALTLPFLFVISLFLGSHLSFEATYPVLGWLLLNGIVIFGISKIFWVESIHRMSVTKAIAISGLNPIFTVLFAWIIIHQAPTYTQLLSLPFLILSIMILTNFKFKKSTM